MTDQPTGALLALRLDGVPELKQYVFGPSCLCDRTEEYGYLLDNRESWLNYMDDVFETDKKGKLTAHGFLM